MKNFLSKLSRGLDGIKNQITSKSTALMDTVKKKVLALSTVTALGVSQPAIAHEWHRVDTPGIGPQEFCQKHFGTKEWRNLVDRNGNIIHNAKKDFKYGLDYTLQSEKTEPVSPLKKEIVSKGENGATTKSVKESVQTITQEKTGSITHKTKKASQHANSFDISFGDLMKLDGFKNFDNNAYESAIGFNESGNKSHARNDQKGKEMGIRQGKYSFGGPQFTLDTLRLYGVDLTVNGEIAEDRVQEFLKNRKLQKDLMRRYTYTSLKQIQKNPQIVFLIQSGQVSLVAMLAKLHISGHGSVNMNWGGADWLGTKVRDYAKNVESIYLKITGKSPQKKVIVDNGHHIEAPGKDNLESTTPYQEAFISSDISAANDAKFETSAPSVEVVTQKVRASNDEVFMSAGDRAILDKLDASFRESIIEKICQHGSLRNAVVASHTEYLSQLRALRGSTTNFLEAAKLNDTLKKLELLLRTLPQETPLQQAA